MTFLGTIPGPLRSIISETARGWPRSDVYVACCGNFTIERTLRGLDPAFRTFSNDVSIYTTALGDWLADKPVQLAVSEAWSNELEWLQPYLDDGVGSVASLMLFTHFAADLGSDHPWKARNVRGHLDQWDAMWKQTCEHLNENKFPIGGYDCVDVREWLDGKVPEDATICSFPPFYTGGYEKLYERLDDIFVWPRPQYEVLDDEGLADVVRKITDRPRWLLGRNVREPDLEDHLVGFVQPAVNAAPFWVYADGSETKTRYVAPEIKTEPVAAPRLMPGDVIGDHMELRPLKQGQFEALRAKYLNAGIRVSSGNLNYPHAVAVDGKIVGVICYGLLAGRGGVLLTTDFAVGPHDYPRLSKLIVLAALSKEAQRINERGWSTRVRWLQTAVFTNAAVSMKYRGVLDLVDRVDISKEPGPFKNKLVYRGEMGMWSLDEALALWKDKWGQTAAEINESKGA